MKLRDLPGYNKKTVSIIIVTAFVLCISMLSVWIIPLMQNNMAIRINWLIILGCLVSSIIYSLAVGAGALMRWRVYFIISLVGALAVVLISAFGRTSGGYEIFSVMSINIIFTIFIWSGLAIQGITSLIIHLIRKNQAHRQPDN